MGSDDQNNSAKDGSSSKPQSNRARQLFGHKGGASPWEKMGETPAPDAQPPERAMASKPGDDMAPIGAALPKVPRPSSSAPYPRDAQYTPRQSVADAGTPSAQPLITGEVDDESELTKLHPNYKLLMRVGALIFGLILVVVSVIAEAGLRDNFDVPTGIVMIPAVLFALFFVIRIPAARYNARGYQISLDRLRVVRGVFFHSDTIVPFGRVQHIDVDQGPVERALNIATLTVHTAGSHNASVSLPGLGHELAVQMREEIRAHIKRETM